MKKMVFSLLIAIGMMGSTKLFAMSEVCFTDVFGYQTSLTITKTAIGYWSVSGEADLMIGTMWPVEGTYDKYSDVMTLTFTNPSPDGCAFYVDNFVYTSTSTAGGTFTFNWTSYCAGVINSTGTGSATGAPGLCAFRTAIAEPRGPLSSDPAISARTYPDAPALEGALSFDEIFAEDEMSVITNSEHNIAINYEISGNTNVAIDIYNHAGQHIATVANEMRTNGFYTSVWNGANASGADAMPGMYIVVLKTDTGSLTKKFIK